MTETETTITHLLTQLIQVIAQMKREQFEFHKTYLDARFPYGKPTDRYGRR